SSVTAGPCARTLSRIRCTSWRRAAIAASPTTVVAMAARHPAAHAQDGGQSRRAPDRPVRPASRPRRRRPLAVLEGSPPAVLRLQQAGGEGVRRRTRVVLGRGMMAGFPAAYFCIKAFSETDLTEDLKKIDVPTLILHGDDDQIVPIGASALLS